MSKDWTEDCHRYWGRLLTGEKAHWCPDWDYLPIDETTLIEIDCCSCDLSSLKSGNIAFKNK